MGGGITNLPLLSADSTNTAVNIQPSSQNEAMARMAMGEQPIQAYDGTMVNTNNSNFRLPTFNTNAPNQGNYSDGPVGLQTRPNLTNVDADKEAFFNLYNDRIKNFNPDIDADLQKRMKLAEPFLTPQKTTGQYQTELQNLLGQGDNDANATNAYLELMKYGANVANSPGNLLQALTTPAPQFAEGLQDIATNKAAQDRQIAIGAYEAQEGDKKALRGERLGLLNQVISETVSTERDLLNNMLSINKIATEKGIEVAENEMKIFNEDIIRTYESNMTFAGKRSETWGKKLADGTMDVKAVRYDAEGPYFVQNGTKVRADDYIPIDAASLSALSQNGGIDMSGSKSVSVTIPDESAIGGYRQAVGVFAPKVGKHFLVQTGVDGQQINVELPDGSLVGKMKDIMDIKEGTNGVITTSWLAGPLAGRTVLSKMELIDTNEYLLNSDPDYDGPREKNPNFNKPIKINRGPNTNLLIAPKYNDEGQLTEGMEYVTEASGPNIGMPFEALDKTTQTNTLEKIIYQTKALDGIEQLLFLANEGILSGPLVQFGQLGTGLQKWNFMSSNKDFYQNGFEFYKTTGAQQLLEVVRKDLQMATALSTRFNQKEQDIIAGWLKGGWKDGKVFGTEIEVLYFKLKNDLEQATALVENRAPMKLSPPPSGTNKDPWKIDTLRDESFIQRTTKALGPDAFKGQRWEASGAYLYDTYKNSPTIPAKTLKYWETHPEELIKGKF
tara:strand:- start:3754 stop:5934 length:2181 start_codon:yes stop_codon:yes gene_type:complete